MQNGAYTKWQLIPDKKNNKTGSVFSLPVSGKGAEKDADIQQIYNCCTYARLHRYLSGAIQDHQRVSGGSIQVNPVIIRKLLSQLKTAGLIEVKRGPGGTSIAKPLEDITFLDIYRAVDCVEENSLFHFHENPNPKCPVGRNIHFLLDDRLKNGAGCHGTGTEVHDSGGCERSAGCTVFGGGIRGYRINWKTKASASVFF